MMKITNPLRVGFFNCNRKLMKDKNKKIRGSRDKHDNKENNFGKNTLFRQEKMGQHIYEKFHHLSVKETSKWLVKTKKTK